MKIITLTQGKFTLVDDQDFEYLNQWKWHFDGGYAVRSVYLGGGRKNQKTKSLKMHRIILKRIGINLDYKGTDHINRNPLDNRRINLRSATKAENACNCKIHITNTSGFKGVSWDKNRKKWEAYIHVDNGKLHLGRFDDKLMAAQIYNQAATKYFGEFARLNIIQ